MRELTDGVVDLTDVFGPAAGSLVARLADGPAPAPEVTRAWRLLHRSEGQITVAHAQLAWGDDGMIMLGSTTDGGDGRLAEQTGPALLYLVVHDPDAHHARAVAAGAEIVQPLTDEDYGSRGYTARDPEGDLWSFGTYQPATPAT